MQANADITLPGIGHGVAVPWTTDLGPRGAVCSGCLNAAGNRGIRVPGDPVSGFERKYFDYSECASCGTLDILEIPADIADYYAEGYYSFQSTLGRGAKGLLRRVRNTSEVFGTGVIGRALASRAPAHRMGLLRPLAGRDAETPLNRESAILDVGCGNGGWLRALHEIGFTNLTGTDPFMQHATDAAGLRLMRARTEDLDGKFDLISCSHAMEHMENPEQELRQMAARLAEGGHILLRIPLAQSYAWRKYGGEWVQLDAPRHLHLYSVSGLRSLAARVGLVVRKTVFDCSQMTILGNEARLAGRGPHQGGDGLPSFAETMAAFENRNTERIARMINRLGTADQASFYMQIAD